jgi:hypothetical protein
MLSRNRVTSEQATLCIIVDGSRHLFMLRLARYRDTATDCLRQALSLVQEQEEPVEFYA